MVTNRFKYHNDSIYKEKVKQWQKKYAQSDKGKLTQKLAHTKYIKTPLGKLMIKRHQQTNKYKQRVKKYRLIHTPIQHLKDRHFFIMENCAICNNSNTEFHHPNNELPLHIYFLCKKCHEEQHWRK